jgi:hypothetical protein
MPTISSAALVWTGIVSTLDYWDYKLSNSGENLFLENTSPLSGEVLTLLKYR